MRDESKRAPRPRSVPGRERSPGFEGIARAARGGRGVAPGCTRGRERSRDALFAPLPVVGQRRRPRGEVLRRERPRLPAPARLPVPNQIELMARVAQRVRPGELVRGEVARAGVRAIGAHRDRTPRRGAEKSCARVVRALAGECRARPADPPGRVVEREPSVTRPDASDSVVPRMPKADARRFASDTELIITIPVSYTHLTLPTICSV